MKRFVAGILTVAIMGLLAWSGRRPPDVSQTPAAIAPKNDAHPAEACVRLLLESGGNGDVSAYLAAFDGSIKSRLEREVGERGRAAFAADLVETARARKSHALFAAEAEGTDQARVVVETVYSDRNERQTYRVERRPAGWRITAVETLRSHQPKARFGDLADYQAPEAPPVPTPPNPLDKTEEEAATNADAAPEP